MALQFRSDNRYAGPADVGSPDFAGMSANEIIESYYKKVAAAGGSMWNESHFENTVESLVKNKVFDRVRFFSMVDARWGTVKSDNAVERAVGLGSFDFKPAYQRLSRSADFSQATPPQFVGDGPNAYYQSVHSTDDGDNDLYASLLSDRFVIPYGQYLTAGLQQRNTGDDYNASLIVGTPTDGRQLGYFDGDALLKDNDGSLEPFMFFALRASDAIAIGTDSRASIGTDEFDNAPAHSTMAIDENAGAFYVLNDEDSDFGYNGRFYDLENCRGQEVAVAFNERSGFSPSNYQASHPATFSQCYFCVSHDFGMSQVVRDILRN